jgi:hypothetical protein
LSDTFGQLFRQAAIFYELAHLFRIVLLLIDELEPAPKIDFLAGTQIKCFCIRAEKRVCATAVAFGMTRPG